ncbi:MAG TPA: MerR family transcriptional regulator [Kiritimatiellia bacterium]|nr:MerR family transcriptional regulator [Kiritimatiellia bacterium]HMP33990.1 MerR family transcriptional regulator [Kiritimatiellia bacterium]
MHTMEIGELAAASGVTRRTIRYYVAIGLLTPPAGTGPRRFYNEEHLERLRRIRIMKEQFLPLDEIKRRLAAYSGPRRSLQDPDDPRNLMLLRAPRDPSDVSPLKRSVQALREEGLPDEVSPSLLPPPPPPPFPVTTCQRETLTPNIDLIVSEHASPAERDLVERLRAVARTHRATAYRDPEAGT